MTRRHPPLRDRQSGFTLIEVMVSFALIMLLTLGLNSLWTLATVESDGLVYRQKAIFRLNGEIERLVAWWTTNDADPDSAKFSKVNYASAPTTNLGSFISSTPSNSYPSTGAPRNRFIYNTSTAGVPVTVVDRNGASDFVKQILSSRSDNSDLKTRYGTIFFSGSNVADTAARNVVWLDHYRNIVAQISWDICRLPGTAISTEKDCDGNSTVVADRPCYSGKPCYLMTMYVDYPFRFNIDALTYAPIEGVPLETITAQTIVGTRRSS